jgi:hypothetical protein
MILPYIFLFIASAIIFSLLIPKPKIEDAKAQEFDENGFPKATENSPIPYLIGKTRLESPNTLYAGDYRFEEVTEKVKTGLFSSKKVVVGYKYYLTFDLGLCLGDSNGCTLHEIWMDDKLIWTGTVTNDTPFAVGDLELFGGEGNGGGFQATCRFFPGNFTQLPGIVGHPAYRGVAHIVFYDAYLGEQPQLRKVSFVVSRFTNRLGLSGGEQLIGTESTNLAEAAYELINSQWGGMGLHLDYIDGPNFISRAGLFFDEGQGVAGAVQNGTEGRSVIQEFMKQADSILSVDPATNKLIIVPLRADYDVGTLPIYNETNIEGVENFTQTMWAELVSQVKVGFKDPSNNYQDSTAIAQDLAVANITGNLKTVSISLPFCKDANIANTVAARELNQLSQIATFAKFRMNRKGFRLRPGSVFKFSWADYNLQEMVMRVRSFEEGDDQDPFLVVDCARDTFDNRNTAISAPSSGVSAPLTQAPLPITVYDYFDAPQFLVDEAGSSVFGAATASFIMMLPQKADNISVSVSATIDDFTMFSAAPFPVVGFANTVVAIDDYADTMIIPSFTITGLTDLEIDQFANATVTQVRQGFNLLWINGELLSYQSFVDNLNGSVTLSNVHRALLNTRQQDIGIGDAVYLIDLSTLSTIEIDAATTPASVRMMPSSGAVTLSPGSVAPINIPLQNAYYRPDPPDYTTVNGLRVQTGFIDDWATINVSWRPRDKSLPSVRLAPDAADTAPAGTTYDLYAFNVTDGGPAIYSSLGIVGTSHSFAFTDFYPGDTIEIRVYAKKDGLTSIEYDPIWFEVNPVNPTQRVAALERFTLISRQAEQQVAALSRYTLISMGGGEQRVAALDRFTLIKQPLNLQQVASLERFTLIEQVLELQQVAALNRYTIVEQPVEMQQVAALERFTIVRMP